MWGKWAEPGTVAASLFGIALASLLAIVCKTLGLLAPFTRRVGAEILEAPSFPKAGGSDFNSPTVF